MVQFGPGLTHWQCARPLVQLGGPARCYISCSSCDVVRWQLRLRLARSSCWFSRIGWTNEGHQVIHWVFVLSSQHSDPVIGPARWLSRSHVTVGNRPAGNPLALHELLLCSVSGSGLLARLWEESSELVTDLSDIVAHIVIINHSYLPGILATEAYPYYTGQLHEAGREANLLFWWS